MKELPNNKSPGSDGLPIEIYKMFWNQLGNLYLQAILEAKKEGKLYIAARRGIITLIPKKERDLLELANWRPITLLTCDYKILAKTFANRIKTVLPQIIHTDQTGFMKGRHIFDNIRKTIEIVEHAFEHQKPYLIMNVDYQKCFDLLEHTAIWGGLRYFGFGENFIEWIQLLYKEMTLSVINNGHFTEEFRVERSVLQGSPLAAYLFLINSSRYNFTRSKYTRYLRAWSRNPAGPICR